MSNIVHKRLFTPMVIYILLAFVHGIRYAFYDTDMSAFSVMITLSMLILSDRIVISTITFTPPNNKENEANTKPNETKSGT